MPRTTVLGWVERVSLPRLGLRHIEAKIDTGARTSALHVTWLRIVEPDERGRPMVELALPGEPRIEPLCLPICEYVHVRDTSGRLERRPVIETELRIGTLRRRARVSLTNRADMLYVMLVGRTALPPGVLVDPSKRHRLRTKS